MNTKKLLLIFIAFLTFGISKAQTADDVFNLLIQKGLVKQTEADSIRAEYAFNQQTIKEKQKTFGVVSGRNISIGGYTQVRYQSLQEPKKIDGFDIRRARLDIKGTFSPEWEYRLQTDFAVSPKIIDAYFVYKPYDGFKITGGQFIVPNSLENTTPDNTLETIDRAQVSGLVNRNKDAIGDQNGRDIGLQVSGSLFQNSSNRFLLDYYLGYFNGQGINKGDLNESKDIAARLVAHPTTFLDFGVSYSNGYDNWETTAAKAATYTGNVLTKAPTNAINTNNVQNRIGADVAVNYNLFSLRAEYLQAQQGYGLKKDGWYAQVGYFVIPTKVQLVAKYDSFDKDKKIAKNTTEFLTLGTNYYVNSFTKIQINYKRYSDNFATASGNKDEIVAQLQLKF